MHAATLALSTWEHYVHDRSTSLLDDLNHSDDVYTFDASLGRSSNFLDACVSVISHNSSPACSEVQRQQSDPEGREYSRERVFELPRIPPYLSGCRQTACPTRLSLRSKAGGGWYPPRRLPAGHMGNPQEMSGPEVLGPRYVRAAKAPLGHRASRPTAAPSSRAS